MGDKSKIDWTDATWNPVVGCSIVSPACTNCYAMGMAARIERMTPRSHYAGTTEPSKTGPVWTGKMVQAPEHILTTPLHWKRPRKIFVNSMGDLFHENVPDEWIDRVFAVMVLCPQHTFQILTKRAKRMREYIERRGRNYLLQLSEPMNAVPELKQAADASNRVILGGGIAPHWPLLNVVLGVTAEDQARADERRDDLGALAALGWATFASYEPALGDVDWGGWEFLKQLISGGESGIRARPAHPDWFRSARDWCAKSSVAYFHKQNGEFASVSDVEGLGDHFSFPDGATVRRVGKKHAGHLIDGTAYREFPAT